MDSGFILPAILIAAIGFVSGVLIAVLFLDRLRPPQEAEETDEPAPASAAAEEPAEMPAPVPAAVVAAPGLADLRLYDTLAQLHREKSSGKLAVEYTGRLLQSTAGLEAGELRDLRQTAESLCLWLGLNAPEIVSGEVKVEVAPYSARPAPAVVAAVSERTRATSVVGQIDEILNEMLAAKGQTEPRVHLAQDPTLGVVVWVGSERFAGIEAVPDDEIRRTIQAAVKEWEHTQLH